MRYKRRLRIIINYLITAMMLAGLVIGAVRKGGVLEASGFENLKFFTVESNVFRGVVSFIMASSLLKGKEPGKGLSVWAYVSTCCVGLTFLVVFAFFGPLYGWLILLRGSNFFFHLVIPLISMADYIVFNEQRLSKKVLFLAAIPPLLYGICYLINLLINGIGYGPDSNDWYGFAIWGIPVGLCIFAAICVACVLTGLILNAANRKVQDYIFKHRHE